MNSKLVITLSGLIWLTVLQAATPPAKFDVTLTVTQFRDVLASTSGGSSPTDHLIAIANENPNLCFLRNGTYARGTEKTTIRVQKDPNVPSGSNVRTDASVVLQFKIDANDGESYMPIGIAFRRADKSSPAAVECTTDRALATDTPFSGLNIAGDVLTVTNSPLRKASPNVSSDTHTTYKFSVIIQRKSDGAIGILDPEIENENLP
jgi:hypothetical protein